MMKIIIIKFYKVKFWFICNKDLIERIIELVSQLRTLYSIYEEPLLETMYKLMSLLQ